MHPETATIPLLEAESGRYALSWRNKGRAGTSWKIRIYDQSPSGKQLAVYERTTTLLRIDHAVGPIPGVKECKCPKSDPRAGLSHFTGGAGVCMSVDGIEALQVLLDRYLSAPNFTSLVGVKSSLAINVSATLDQSVVERRRRLAVAPKKPQTVTVTTIDYVRNQDVVAEVLDRAAGTCELCKLPAPFLRASNLQPYLEVHHKVPLADKGDDTVENAIAVCPNCHRKEHFGEPSQANVEA